MIKKILLPTDGSEYAEKTILFAMDLAKSLGARVNVMYAYQPTLLRKRAAILTEEYRHALDEEAREIVSELAERFKAEGIPVEATVVEGSAAEAILRAVDELNPDLVVMGSRGEGSFANALLGGVAEQVVHHSRSPVLVVK
jgi:nucleotide-binding universal stress UspA family protein